MRKIFLCGSTQTEHIGELLQNFGYVIKMDIEEDANALTRKLLLLQKLAWCDVLYVVGGWITYHDSVLLKMARLLQKKVVVHWIGTDVFNALKAYKDDNSGLCMKEIDVNLSGSKLLKRELATIGIESIQIPIVPYKLNFSSMPMPEKHGVLVYLPKGRESFYGLDVIESLVCATPDVLFHVVANNGIEQLMQKNVIFHGVLTLDQMKELYKEISIVVRVPQHDGLSMMVIEALGMGRNVLYKYEHPFATTPKSDSITDVKDTFLKMIATAPKLNEAGSQYVHEYYAPEEIIKLYEEGEVL